VEDLEVNPAFWRGKRVLVTGHTGFKGAWLALWLHSLGARVLGYSIDIPSRPSLFEVASVAKLLEHRIGDVQDFPSTRAVLQDFSPEAVFHLAAKSLVRYSYEHPLETYATNVMGTAHVLEAARQAPSVRAIVIVTSDKCYENRETQRGYVETDPMGGRDPYSSSKGCAELVTSAYRASFFDGTDKSARAYIASARAGNVIGGGDWSRDRLIPDVYRAAAAKTPVLIRNPKAVRPWQHVLDPLSGYLTLAERLLEDGADYAQAWNFGPPESDARPVAEILDRVVALWGDGLHWEIDAATHPHEAMLLMLDCSKARELGWKPCLRLDTALEWTASWYKSFLGGAEARRLCEDQIARYQRMEAA
jgi:CDP-glucose 4,6-dehydratase